jgi:hypothetical protein
MLKAQLSQEEYDALPEAVQEHYVEKDGVFSLGVTPTEGLELVNTTGLKKTLQKERAAKEAADKARKALEAKWGDLDPDAAVAALKTVEELAGMDPEGKAKAELEAIEKSLTEKFETDRKTLTEKFTAEAATKDKILAAREAQLEQQLIAAAAAKAIAEAGGSVELLQPIIRGQTKMKPREDGGFDVVVLDGEGAERLSPVAGSTTPMSITELVSELAGNKTYARAFDGSGASGSGAGRSGSSGSSGSGAITISLADSKDVGKYRAAKAAADKAGKPLQIAST